MKMACRTDAKCLLERFRQRGAGGTLLWALFGLFLCLPANAGAISLTTLGTPYTQNFDTLPASGSTTWTNNATIPGWFHARTGTGTTIVANDGSSNAGNLYSYGTGTATDRALGAIGSGNAAVGNLFWGVRLQNNTGATITQLDVSYTGEQWRNSAAAAQTVVFSYLVGSPTVSGALAEFQAAGVAVPALDFTTPITGGVAGALNGNLAANRAMLTFSITGLNIPNGTEVMLRWSDPDHTGADHGLAIDDFTVTPQGGVPTPALNISNVTMAEGDPPGTTTFTFAVTLTAPAGPGGVTFDIATADGTAQDDNPVTEDSDYGAQSLTGQTIPAGSSGPFDFSVTINRDTAAEPNETFFVNVTNITGADAGDSQGQGTINNDDVTLTPIHDIQGSGASSPIVGASVTTRGIVTGVRSNGFFIQEPDPSVDADPLTSEGILVFTGSAPPAAAAVGNLVQVTGTVAEFVPPADLLQPPLTELTSPTVVQLSIGNPLPAAIPLTATFPDPAGVHDQLERVEGMRVAVASLTVSGPTLGSINAANAVATSSGVFFGTITGVPRPQREAGIQAPDPAPSGGTIPPIPRFDANPERLRVDSDGLVGGPLLDVSTGAVLTGLVGPLDYTFRTYTILPDPAAAIGVTGGATATSATPPTAGEFTVASYNMLHFYDTADDPGIDDVLTPAAFDKRLNKASLGIRNNLGMPDILAAVEMENLTTLEALAARISADAIAAGQPDPQYAAYLVEGNDIAGIDVGFLVKTAEVAAGIPRVEVAEVVQELAGTLFVNPDSSTELLHERPPLRLMASIHYADGRAFPVTVIANHLRSLNGNTSEAAGTNGWATVGARVRAKRQMQAADLANLVQARQTAVPDERILLLGDFNAYEFNDGLVDVMNVIAGTPPPDNETAVPGDGIDLVNPDLDNLVDTPPAAERYSYIYDGQTQNIDHILVNQALIAATSSQRLEHPRINADFPATDGNDATTPRRLSDHDPAIAFIALIPVADLAITKTDSPDPVLAGSDITYTIQLAGNGPDMAENVEIADPLPTGTTFVSAAVTSGSGWSLTTPAVGANGTVVFSKGSVAKDETATFTITVKVDSIAAHNSVVTNTASVSSTTDDPNSDNNASTSTTTVLGLFDLTVAKTHVGAFTQGQSGAQYTLTVTNGGYGPTIGSVTVADTLPAGLTAIALTGSNWACDLAARSCTRSDALAVGASYEPIILTVDVAPDAAATLTNAASVTVSGDGNTANNTAADMTTINPSPETTITAQPATPTLDTAATFAFTGSGGTGARTFECQLEDGGAFAPCTSPVTYNGLADAAHTFRVRAVDANGVGDATPASCTWTIDTTPPDTTISGQPSNPTLATEATFVFTGSDGGTGIAAFECQLDAGGWNVCSSPQTYTNLSRTGHTFQVRSRDVVANTDPTPAIYTWNIDVDTDGDGIGNNADSDDDGDGVPDSSDSFPLNGAETLDTDGDGTGNNADSDDDGDGIPDSSDPFPFDGAETLDTDGDGIGDTADGDDDNDGISDLDEIAAGTDPLNPDTEPPVLLLSTLADGAATNAPVINVGGRAYDADSGLHSVTVNDAEVPVVDDGSFSIALTLTPGSNTLVVVATDNAGNKTAQTRTFTLDASAPGLTIDHPADNSFTATVACEVAGRLDDPQATVTASVNGGAAVNAALEGNAFTVVVQLAPGVNTIDIVVTDPAGNRARAKRTLTLDNVAPELTIDLPAADTGVRFMPVAIGGSVADALSEVTLQLTVNGEAVTPGVDGNTFTYPLTATQGGSYQVQARAVDLLGNSASVIRNILYTPYGDADGNGLVEIADALAILKMAVGSLPANLEIGDVAPLIDGVPHPDGRITAADALLILRRALGLVNW